MQALSRFALVAVTASPLLLLGLDSTADNRATDRFQHSGVMPLEQSTDAVTQADFFSEAPTGFDNRTNGFLPQGPAYETINEDNVVPDRSFNDNRFIFEEVEVIADGPGADVQRAELCRVPSECRRRRRQPGRRASHREARRVRRLLRIGRRLADPFACDQRGDRRARRVRG
jgi:hypothetical protein